jgi:carboxylesterase type B
VIVNIHGGAFMFGSGSEIGPKYLLDKDIILVTLNYRLGPLGKITPLFSMFL